MKIIFNQAAKLAQRDRAVQSLDLSRKVEYLRDFTAKDLSDRFLDVKRNFENILDLGSSSGNVHKFIDKRVTMFNQSRAQLFRDEIDGRHKRVVGEMEELSSHFKDNTFDAVVSNLSLHWENDLLKVLVQARNVLKPDGMFMAAILGGDTLYELRTSMQLAETERDGGVSPHVSPMVQHQDMGGLLSSAGFKLTTVDVDEVVVNYPSMFELLMDLKAMGEGNALVDRKSYVSRDTFMAANQIYKAVYGKDDKIPATFQIIYMIGWKEHESQPKPKPRGSATKSFKDL